MNTTRVFLAGAVLLLGTCPEAWAADAKPKKPSLEVRAVPRMGFSPLTVLFIAELKGGDDVEQYYCPEVEWEWSDGGKSVQESDCPPYEDGTSKIGRRFTTEHVFRYSGNYRVSVRLLKARKAFAKADVSVTVRAGLGEPERRY